MILVVRLGAGSDDAGKCKSGHTSAAHLCSQQAKQLVLAHDQVVGGAHMGVVGADAVDAQPHRDQKQNHKRGDRPIQHLSVTAGAQL